MDIYYCVPLLCVCVPNMCTCPKPKGNGQERGPSWLASKIKCQKRKENLKLKFCLGQIRVSKDWALTIYRVQWAHLRRLCVQSSNRQKCSLWISLLQEGTQGSNQTHSDSLCPPKNKHNDKCRWCLHTMTSWCISCLERPRLISVIPAHFGAWEWGSMILIDTCDNWDHPGKLGYTVMTLIIMYRKVSKECDGLLRPVARARGIVVTSMKSPTGGAEREGAERERTQQTLGRELIMVTGCPVVAVPQRESNNSRQVLCLPQYHVPFL